MKAQFIQKQSEELEQNLQIVDKELEDLQTDNELKIVVRDTAYNSGEATLMFRVKQ